MTPFFVQIKCELGKSYQVANELAEAEIASEIYSTAGDYDLLVKFYVDANTDIGTIFHDVLPDGSKPKHTQMRFAPNTGYAFAVGDDTWHSADPVHDRVKTRDSILLTYFVDQGVLKVLRNRGKRLGNFLLNEIRQRV